jgi:hypothetical protein
MQLCATLGRLGELTRNERRVPGKQVNSANVVREIRKSGDREAFKASGNADQQGCYYRNQSWISHNADGTYEALGVRGQMIPVIPAVGFLVVLMSSHPLADSWTTYPVNARAMAALANLMRPAASCREAPRSQDRPVRCEVPTPS